MATEHPVLKKFGNQLRELRQKRQLSQEAFAAECGFDRTYVSGIERGLRNVSLLNLERLSRCLGISLSELLKNL
jgi:transcriptional regulator with XRE-family HTH domain